MCRLFLQSFCLVVLLGTLRPCQAQFREINPGDPPQKIEKDLIETKQRFQRPKVAKPKTTKTPVQGTPTPAKRKVPVETKVKQPAPKTAANRQSNQTSAAPTPAEPVKVAAKPKKENKKTPTKKEPPRIEKPVEEVKKDVEPIDIFTLFIKPELTEEQNYGVLTFNGIEVGVSTFADIKELWGKPAKNLESDGQEKLVYGAPGLRQIGILADGVAADDDSLTIHSMTFHLQESTSVTEFTEKLGITNPQPVGITDDDGVLIGFALPEYGVLLGLEDGSDVTMFSIENVSAEFFVMRAETQVDHNYSQDLSDLLSALQIEPSNGHAYWLLSELLAKMGKMEEAHDAISAAMELSQEPLYKLSNARLQAEFGHHKKAVKETEEVLEDKTCHQVVKAKANYQLGNLLASGPEPEFESAIKSHLKAIDMAATEMRSKNVKIRRMAKRLLVDSHLSVAQDIALGSFQRKGEVVPKWLIRATELAEDLIEAEDGDETVRLDIFRTTLGIYSILPTNFDASIPAEDAVAEAKRLIANSEDELYHRAVQRKLIETLFYAAKVEQKHGRSDSGKDFAGQAVSLLEDQTEDSQTVFDRYVAGQIYFIMGSVHAIGEANHQEAVSWFEKATEIFEDEDLHAVVSPTAYGELYVSMGVSFWEAGQRDKAVKLTEKGSELMQESVQAGALPLETMQVPYANLAAMHNELGNKVNAEHFSEMTAKIEKQTKTR